MKNLFLLLFTFGLFLSAGFSYSRKTESPLPHLPPVSARAFRKAPQDKGFRRDIEERIRQLPVQNPHSFYLFLEMYQEEPQALDKMKIMRAYYQHFSKERYRLVSLMFLFNAWLPQDPTLNKLLFGFLREHLYELQVLELFLYRFANLPGGRGSFVSLYKSLRRNIPGFSFPSLISLLFFDAMAGREMRTDNYEEVRRLLTALWQDELRRQTALYQDHRDLFRRFNSFYNLAARRKDFPGGGYQEFVRQREQLLADSGYDFTDVILLLEESLKVPEDLEKLPDFVDSAYFKR
jgi:hypothetical protein